jgi:aquaporin Z
MSRVREALRGHWPEYLMEAAGLGAFMVSACVFGTLLEHPASPLRHAIQEPWLRRVLMGLAMGSTAVAIVYSPWGQQSGAHLNPSVTLAFFRLGRVPAWDAVFYATAQFAGGALGVAVASLALGAALGDPAVNYVATVPGRYGVAAAAAAELAISFVLMFTVLNVASRPQLAKRTGLVAGALVALYIAVEAPVSGMSMNPARSLASALPAGQWAALAVYFVAPPLGMLLAAEAFRTLTAPRHGYCAKLHHANKHRCIFCPPPTAPSAA